MVQASLPLRVRKRVSSARTSVRRNLAVFSFRTLHHCRAMDPEQGYPQLRRFANPNRGLGSLRPYKRKTGLDRDSSVVRVRTYMKRAKSDRN